VLYGEIQTLREKLTKSTNDIQNHNNDKQRLQQMITEYTTLVDHLRTWTGAAEAMSDFGKASTLTVASVLIKAPIIVTVDADRCGQCNTVLTFDSVSSLLICSSCHTARTTLFLFDDSAVDVLLSKSTASGTSAMSTKNKTRSKSTSRMSVTTRAVTAKPNTVQPKIDTFREYLQQFADTAPDIPVELLNACYIQHMTKHVPGQTARPTALVALLKGKKQYSEWVSSAHRISMLYNGRTPPSLPGKVIDTLVERYTTIIEAQERSTVPRKSLTPDTVTWVLLRMLGHHDLAKAFALPKTRTVLRSTYERIALLSTAIGIVPMLV
jgi:hypothetical protein